MFEEYRCEIEHDNCNCIFICLPVGTGRVVSVSDLDIHGLFF